MKINKIWLFIISVAIPLFIGFVGSLLTTPNIDPWYMNLNKPWFAPPNWLFSPAWTALFILMGLALFLILKDGRQNRYLKAAYLSYGAQLFLNIYWSFLFFYIKAPGLAFYAIISLWSMIFVNIYYFYQIKKTAGYLLIPYLFWVTFAAVLNYSVWLLNI